jgi:hypothetical protein
MLKKDQLDALVAKGKRNRAVLSNLQKYIRHNNRIITLTRVLDPDDKKARLLQGTAETVQAEILRRSVEMERVEGLLLAALK